MHQYSCWKDFFKEKMANLKVFIAKVCKTYIIDSTSFTKTVKFSIEIRNKMLLIGSYACSRSINEQSHLCLAKYL